MRSVVQEMVALGNLPTDSEADRDEATFSQWNALVEDLEKPATDHEAKELLACFPDDETDCYGLAWTLLHFIESAPGIISSGILREAPGPWGELLRQRARNAGAEF